MQDFAEAVAPLLAGVLGVAAIAKIRRPSLTRAAVLGFGLPAAFAPPLPGVELLAAGALLASPRLGGLLASVLFVLFTALVADSLKRRRAVRCGCFGAADDRPVDLSTLVRNIVLLGASVSAAVFGPWRLHRPALPAVIAVATAAAASSVVVALIALRADTGTLFATRTPT